MRARPSEAVRIGVDTGGTFTDLVVLGPGSVLARTKVRSTPENPARAVLQGLRRLGLLNSASLVIHGTTVATNAFLQRREGRTALVTTRGFEDVLALGRQARQFLYRLDPPSPPQFVPTKMRLGLEERLGPAGEVIVPLRRGSLVRLLRRLRRLRPDAVAICLLHSYVNPAHEKQAASLLRQEGWHLSLSHRVAGEFREFERTSTTVANATLAKPVEEYLATLRRRLGERRLKIMGSSGGWMTARRAVELPVRTLLSGPAGGVAAASLLGKLVAERGLISLDVGGTSTDVALCLGDVPRVARTSLDGVPLLMSTLDIRSLGAGGGSIARRDAGGALRVGPESAGAEPGPACYAHGGRRATLTDAHLALGRLPANGLLDGEMPLDEKAARAALARLGRSLGMSVEETARGILRVMESSLESSIRILVAGKGFTPSSLTLCVFGGAGGLHACALARTLGLKRILVPPDPGTFSALGLASSAATWEASRTVLRRFRHLDERGLGALTQGMEREGKAVLAKEGHEASALRVIREADLRYAGQSHELTLPMGARLLERFHRIHARAFGYARPAEEVDLVTVRVRVVAAPPQFSLARHHFRRHRAVTSEYRKTWLETGLPRRLAIFARTSLSPGAMILGPALITEYSATTYLALGFRLEVGGFGEMVLTRAKTGLS